jgi:hypothetical protein
MPSSRAALAVFTITAVLPAAVAYAGDPPKLKEGLGDIRGEPNCPAGMKPGDTLAPVGIIRHHH